MDTRVYTLAKKLNLDSKEILDLCRRAGVTGKGSALASLNDEEVARVRAYLSGDRQRPADSETAGTKQPELTGKTGSSTREEYLAGCGTVEESRTRRTLTGERADQRRVGRRLARKEAVNRVATTPAVSQPTASSEAKEPAAQEPQGAGRATSMGESPLRRFTKWHRNEQAKRVETTTQPPSVASGARALETPPLPVKPARKDGRRAADTGSSDDDGLKKPSLLDRGARQQRRRARQEARLLLEGHEEDIARLKLGKPSTVKTGEVTAPRKAKVVVEMPCLLRSFSEATGVSTATLQRSLMQLRVMATINSDIDFETAELLAAQLDLNIELTRPRPLEETLLTSISQMADDPADLRPRPPVVTFLGHVDHGKTSLLDRIIGTDVVSGEAGGITQHICAYEVQRDGQKISFVDTPGHGAFTEMRARGANVTDIAVLVVAANDGVMPQTEEAISHAKAAEVPIVVALNKIDLPGANAPRVMQQLAERDLLPSEWGGDVEVVETSATTGEGIDQLLETLLVTAELYDYKANPDRAAFGICLEATQEPGRGVVAKLIVQNGTLQQGDVVVCGSAHGRVKAMYDTLKSPQQVSAAGPSMPVSVAGLDMAPDAGDPFYVLNDLAQARQIAAGRAARERKTSLAGHTARVSFEEFQRRLAEGGLDGQHDVTELNLILRADVRGSLEAIENELGKLDHPEVKINLLQATVGAVATADVTLADASDAVIVAFNVGADEAARTLAEQRGLEIRRYDVIYNLTDDVKAMLSGKLKPVERIVELGRALVQQVFRISRIGTVAGCRVLAGVIERGCRIRVTRDGRRLGEYTLESLRREKNDAKQVHEGLECGIKLARFDDLKEADILEAYKIEQVARTL